MHASTTYRFGDLTLDAGLRRLERAGEPIELGKLTYALLVALVDAAPNVVSHEELVQRVWGGRLTSPETVTQRVKLLRDALGDSADQPRYIGLVRGQGYRLLPPVTRGASAAPQPSAGGAAGPATIDARPPLEAALHPSTSDAQLAAALVKRHRRLAAAVAAVLILGLAGAAYLVAGRPTAPASDESARPSRDFEIRQLTNSGNAAHASISPDGSYVVYIQERAGSAPAASLWVRQIATSRNIEIVPAEPGVMLAVPTITPDGDFVDFGRAQTTSTTPELWRVPLLGGTPRLLAAGVWSAVGWSPDGQKMAYVRNWLTQETALAIADADGRHERLLVTRQPPRFFLSMSTVGGPPVRPAWSPDGKTIALFEQRDLETPLVFVDAATGADSVRDSGGSHLPQGVAWLGPRSLVISQPEELGQRIQLWRMSYPDGSLERLTNDLSSYIGVDVDAARASVVTSRRDRRVALWVADAAGAVGADVVPPLPFGGTIPWLSWAGERVLLDMTIDGHSAVASIAPAHGNEPKEIVANAVQGVGTSDGSTVVFVRGNDGLWRTDAHGRAPSQLVTGEGLAVEPVVTPDDRHVIFLSSRAGVMSPWSVPLGGGRPTQIVETLSYAVDVSPDGRKLLLGSTNEQGIPIIVVCELPACENRRDLVLPENTVRDAGRLRFTPDGRSVAYPAGRGTNLWSLPLDGGPPSQLTHFPDDAGPVIARFAWSRDGRRLALTRTTAANDIVLFRGLAE
jgi:Tol biopolymer transport system component/DNA-binding winged helix-turn-helix (wHTH) protein